MSRWEHFKALIMGEKPINLSAIEESKSVRALKKHLGTMEEIISAQDELLRQYAKEAKDHKQGNMEEKVIDTLIGFFAPTSKQTSPQIQLESGAEFSDTQLNSILSALPSAQKTLIKSAPLSIIKSQLESRGVNISETSILRAKELLK